MNGKVQINPLPILIPFEKEIPILVLRNHNIRLKNCIKSVKWLHLYLHILANQERYWQLTTMEVPTIVARRNKYKENKTVAIVHNAISNAQNNRSPRYSKTEEK